jgi:hypothetical protein
LSNHAETGRKISSNVIGEIGLFQRAAVDRLQLVRTRNSVRNELDQRSASARHAGLSDVHGRGLDARIAYSLRREDQSCQSKNHNPLSTQQPEFVCVARHHVPPTLGRIDSRSIDADSILLPTREPLQRYWTIYMSLKNNGRFRLLNAGYLAKMLREFEQRGRARDTDFENETQFAGDRMAFFDRGNRAQCIEEF